MLFVAGFPVTQGVAFEVKARVTTAPLVRVDVVKLALVAPETFKPLILHW